MERGRRGSYTPYARGRGREGWEETKAKGGGRERERDKG